MIDRSALAEAIASRKLPPEHHERALYWLNFIDNVQGVQTSESTVPTKHDPPTPNAPETFVPTAMLSPATVAEMLKVKR